MGEKLDRSLVENYMNNFFGYGNFDGDYWLVGIEERGGENYQDVKKRIEVWDNRGCKELEDVREYHIDLDIEKHFKGKYTLQPTWSKLIRLLLTAEGKGEMHLAIEDVKVFQANELARPHSNHCLIELFPLPCPQTNEKSWKYNEYTDIEYLETRKSYEDYIGEKRIEVLKDKIKKHKPKAVIFYSTDKNKLEHWNNIVENSKNVFNIKNIEGEETYYHNDNDTHYIVVPHPVRHGMTNKYFETVGEFIKQL